MRVRPLTRHVTCLSLLVGVLTIGMVAAPRAVAGSDRDGPRLERATATVVANVEREDVGSCTGPGGDHFRVDLVIRGPVESTDRRLRGEFIGHVRVLVKRVPVDGDAYIGHGRDDFEIRGGDGALKARGSGFFVFDQGKPMPGMLFAALADGSTWISNFTVLNQLVSFPIVSDDALGRLGGSPLGKRGPVVVVMGGPASSNPGDPGLIQAGFCAGGLGPDPLRERPVFP